MTSYGYESIAARRAQMARQQARRKRLAQRVGWLLVVAVGVILALTACGSPSSPGDTSGQYEPVTVTLSDGQQVQCVIWDGVRSGNITCDWGGDQ